MESEHSELFGEYTHKTIFEKNSSSLAEKQTMNFETLMF